METNYKTEIIIDAGDAAKQRLYAYLDERLKGELDTTKWEFFSFLLKQAENHKLDISGYGSLEYQKDREKAELSRSNRENENHEKRRLSRR
jgi:hypothetical protein